LDFPGRRQAQGDGKQGVGVHDNTMGLWLDRQLPTDLGKEPFYQWFSGKRQEAKKRESIQLQSHIRMMSFD
jgi:hypothetical protein